MLTSNQRTGIDPLEFYFTCVKEKFGLLRVYTSRYLDATDKAIGKAVEESERTCESCGEIGEMRHAGWMAVRCDDCEKRYREWKAQRDGTRATTPFVGRATEEMDCSEVRG